MRWPIQIQLLLPMLLIAVLALALASAASSYLDAARARQQQEENLRRVTETLTKAPYPPTETVLRQVSGLSGAEFVLLYPDGQLEASTLPLDAAEIESLGRIPIKRTLTHVSEDAVGQFRGDRYLGHRIPVAARPPITSGGSLVVLYQVERWRSAMREAAYPAVLAGGVAAIAAILLTSLLARRLVQPIRRLCQETARIAEGRFSPLPVPRRNDEIRDLTLSVNSMAERLHLYEEEVRTSERLRTLGQLGAAVAHQLRNSATGARMAIELHQRQCTAGNDPESLGVALRQLRLMESYLQQFLRVGRDEPLEFQEVDLASVVQEVMELVRPSCVHGKVELTYCPSPVLCAVRGNADALRELLTNVVLNAIEAARRPGEAAPRVIVELDRADNHHAVVRVKDSGVGPEGAVRDRLFQPFASEKPEGAGLGLFVAQRIAAAHGGAIGWERREGMTCFSVELPLLSSPENHGTSADR